MADRGPAFRHATSAAVRRWQPAAELPVTGSESESGAGAGSRSPLGGRRRWRLARSCLRALLTDSTVESSMSLTSRRRGVCLIEALTIGTSTEGENSSHPQMSFSRRS
jgi:hypothetical protein